MDFLLAVQVQQYHYVKDKREVQSEVNSKGRE